MFSPVSGGPVRLPALPSAHGECIDAASPAGVRINRVTEKKKRARGQRGSAQVRDTRRSVECQFK